MTDEPVPEIASEPIARVPVQAGRILCGLILVLMAIALAYTGWTASSYFAHIRV